MEKISFYHNRTESSDASVFDRHCHAGAELLYVAEGEGEYSIEGRRFPLRPGTLGLFRANEYHFVCPRADCPYERYVVNFDVDVPFGEAGKMRFVFCNDEDRLWFDAPMLDKRIPEAFREFSHIHELYETGNLTEGALFTLEQSLITEILLLLPVCRERKAVKPDRSLSASVTAYLNDHLTEKITLDDLSNVFYVSKSYLCRAFRRATGVSVFSYLNTKRVIAARDLIRSGFSPAEAAQKVGFGDYSVFFRAYKKEFSSSPCRAAES